MNDRKNCGSKVGSRSQNKVGLELVHTNNPLPRSDFSHSVSAAVSAEAELHMDDLGDDLDGTEIVGDSSNG